MSATDERYYFVCRLCALKCGQLTADDSPHSSGVPIFSDEGAQRQVPKKILDCLQFAVHDGDKFPRTVCRDCLGKLDDSHEFLIKCLESQQFLADLATHEVFTIYEQKHPHHHLSDGVDGVVVDDRDDDGLPDTCPAIIAADLEQLVDEAHMHATDITQMIRYHDGHHDMNDVGMHEMEQLAVDLGDTLPVGAVVGTCGVADDGGDDDDSLPDITLYSFDGIPVADSVKEPDTFDLDEAAASFQVENGVSYADRVDDGLYTPSVHNEPMVESIAKDVQADALDVRPMEGANSTMEAMPTIIEDDNLPQPPPQPQTPSGTKVCNVCAKTFATNYKLTVHQRTHSQERPFRCNRPECGKTFRSKSGLAQHEAQHTGAHQFACAVCGKGFQVRSYLTSHMKCHSDAKPYECGECGERFRAKQTLVDHEARHLGVKAFRCGSCEQCFISKALCVRHEKIVHGGGGDGMAAAAVQAEQQFGCTLCTKQYTRKAYLKTHMLSHSGERPFACDLCDRRMSTANDLKLHRRTHTGEAAYVCETCGKPFKRSDTLAVHRRSHTGEKPYECSHCGQRFTQATAMKLHERLHSGERPYACPVCPRWFVSGSILTAHLKKHNNRTVDDDDDGELLGNAGIG